MSFFKKIFSKKEIVNTVLTISVFCLSLIPLLWLRDNQILLGYDNVYPLNAVDFLRDRIFSWTSVQGFGLDQSGQQGSLMIHFIDSIPQLLGASTQLSQKIVFSFWFFMLIFAAYIFVVKIEQYGFIKSKYLRYIFPVLYGVNFYVLQAWWVAERTKFSLMVATPLILIILLSLVKSKVSKTMIVKKSIVAAFILTIFNGGGWGGMALYGGLLVVLFCFYLYHSTIVIYRKEIKELSFLSLFMFLFALFYIFLNAYTLLPFVLSTLGNYSSFLGNSGGITGLISWTRYLSVDTSFINLLRLQGIPEWYNSFYHPYAGFYIKNTFLVLVSFSFPILLFTAILIKNTHTRKTMPFLIFLLLVALFFTAGSHPPLGFIYEFLMQKVPGFIIFRSAFFKFGYAFWFCASLLIGLSLSEAIGYLVTKFKRFKALGFILPLIVAGFLVAYHFPYLTGDIFRIDKTDVSSRVELPSYVGEFSSWWKKNGGDDKVLLLPKLNDNWIFEQYKWNYLSLFPVLGNFANNGLVENSDQLNSMELSSVNYLYSAINNGNHRAMDKYSSLLGISYFLVRKDFYYNIPTQNTDDPQMVENALKRNPKIKLIKIFGQWALYGYQHKNSLFFTANEAISSNAGDYSLSAFDGNLLPLEDSAYDNYSYFFKKNLIIPNCMSCEAEKEKIVLDIPRPRVLIDSAFYSLARLKEKLNKPNKETYDQHLFSVIGGMLRNAGQISELINQNKDEEVINEATKIYISSIRELSKELDNIKTKSSNPYKAVINIEYYLEGQIEFLSKLLKPDSARSYQLDLEKIMHEIDVVSNRLNEFYGRKDFDRQKYYFYDVKHAGDYTIKIPINSLGNLAREDIGKIGIQFNSQEVISSTESAGFLYFGKVRLNEGSNILKLILPRQENLLSDIKQEKILGSNCFSSFVNFSSNLAYSLTFSSRNNFDPIFFYFIDYGGDFNPLTTGYFPNEGERFKSNRIVISSSSFNINPKATRLRISFCSPSLKESLYRSNIANLSMVILTRPEIILEGNSIAGEDLKLPNVSFKKINQTHYRVFITNASDPFLLVFAQRYSAGWVSTLGQHVQGNNFENAWVVDEEGDYSMDIKYNPQKYFYFGIIISALSLVVSLFLLLKLHRRK